MARSLLLALIIGLGAALLASAAEPGKAAPRSPPEEEAPTIREPKPWEPPTPGPAGDPMQDFDQLQEHMNRMFEDMDQLFEETWGRPFSPGFPGFPGPGRSGPGGPGRGPRRPGGVGPGLPAFPPEFDDPSTFMRGLGGQGFGGPEIDLVEEAGRYRATIDLPGATPADVRVSVEDGVLRISGTRREQRRQEQGNRILRQERVFGSFTRTVPLPGPVDAAKLELEFEKGVLTVTIPKKIR